MGQIAQVPRICLGMVGYLVGEDEGARGLVVGEREMGAAVVG